LFKQASLLVKEKEHLTVEGLRKILSLKGSLNNGLSTKLKVAFPNIEIVERPYIDAPQGFDPNWLAGFTDGEGCFSIDISPSATTRTGFGVGFRFSLIQHSRDTELLKTLVEFLACGRYVQYSNKETGEYRVTKYKDIQEIIIPFFNNYPLVGVKLKYFEHFKRAVEVVIDKGHLTPEGLEEIRLIKAGMNRGREN
jgi:LAGLIDADG endonuclease